MTTKIRRRSLCPLSCSLDLFGDKWTLLVVRDLFLGKMYFDEFVRSPEKIASNVLTERLKRLVDLKYVEKIKDEDDGRRVKYSITKKGLGLKQVMIPLMKWGIEEYPKAKPLKVHRVTPWAAAVKGFTSA